MFIELSRLLLQLLRAVVVVLQLLGVVVVVGRSCTTVTRNIRQQCSMSSRDYYYNYYEQL